MEPVTQNTRLNALDGVRGVAILLVIFTHVSAAYIQSFLPPLISQMLFSSGVTGVSLLFILSGFFMASLYPDPTSRLGFLQKRYTRIFPLFLTFVLVRLFITINPNLIWWQQLVLMIVLSLGTYFLWTRVIKKWTVSAKQILFLGFLFLQILVGAFYAFFIMRHTALFYETHFSLFARQVFVGLVNGTLTLPFGDYVPLLDGVYWSLIAEVLFYILYPFICVPIVRLLIPIKRIYKIFLLLSLIPFFSGLSILLGHIFFFSIIQVYICFYFVTGIVLGHIYRHHPLWTEQVSKVFPGRLAIILFLASIFLKTISFNYFSHDLHPLIHILWAFPITLFIGVALVQTNALSKFLQFKLWTFYGMISYSLYVAHSTILYITEHLFVSNNLITNITTVVISCGAATAASYIFYLLLEAPYFARTHQASQATSEKKIQGKFIFIVISALSLVGILISYQSRFNFFSIQQSLTQIQTQSVLENNYMPLENNQTQTVIFTATDPNLSIISMHVVHRHTKLFPIVDSPGKFVIAMQDPDTRREIAKSIYDIKDINDSPHHLFGFSNILSSANRQYLIVFSLHDALPSEYLLIDMRPSTLVGDYVLDKKTPLSHPTKFLLLLFSKLETIIMSTEARVVGVLFLPWLIITSLIVLKSKRI